MYCQAVIYRQLQNHIKIIMDNQFLNFGKSPHFYEGIIFFEPVTKHFSKRPINYSSVKILCFESFDMFLIVQVILLSKMCFRTIQLCLKQMLQE